MFIVISSAPISTPFKAFLVTDGDTAHSKMILFFSVPFRLINGAFDGLILFVLLFFQDDNLITVSSTPLGFPLNVFGGNFISFSFVSSCCLISGSISSTGLSFLDWMS